MKTSGIVLEVHRNTVTVMTPDGRFCRLARYGHVEVGQEYSGRKPARPWLAAAAVFLLLFVSALYPLSSSQAVAYVSVDINPSLELGVSRNLHVVSATALNAEASDLLADLRLKGLPLAEAVEAVLQAAEEKDYFLGDSPAVVVASSPAGKREGYTQDIQALLEVTVERYVAKKASPVAAAVVSSNRQIRAEAQELGLSVGKYAVLMEAREEGLALEAQALREKGIGRALLDLEVRPGDVLRRVNRRKDKPQKPDTKEKGPGNKPEPAEEPETGTNNNGYNETPGNSPGNGPETPSRPGPRANQDR